MMKHADSNVVVGAYEAPDWLRETLRVASMPPELRERCEQAALRALDVARLRAARERTGFVAVPLPAWFRGLAQIGGVELAPLLEWFGVPDLSRPTPETAGPISRLAREVAFQLRETLALLRTTVAHSLGYTAIPLLAAAHRYGTIDAPAAADPVAAAEQTLAEVEALYDDEKRIVLRAILDAAKREYDDTH